jgi:hypothetical protein
LTHVSQTRTETAALRTKNSFLENRPADFAFGSMNSFTGFRSHTAGFKSDALHNLAANEKFGIESGAVVCARPAGGNNVAANMAMIKAHR